MRVRAASLLKCDVCFEHDLHNVTCQETPRGRGRNSTNDQGVGVDLFVLADFSEELFEFFNIVDPATRITICLLMPSKRPDDVLSVFQMVSMN